MNCLKKLTDGNNFWGREGEWDISQVLTPTSWLLANKPPAKRFFFHQYAFFCSHISNIIPVHSSCEQTGDWVVVSTSREWFNSYSGHFNDFEKLMSTQYKNGEILSIETNSLVLCEILDRICHWKAFDQFISTLVCHNMFCLKQLNGTSRITQEDFLFKMRIFISVCVVKASMVLMAVRWRFCDCRTKLLWL